MENRQSIHYTGNTVIPPHPSAKNLKRRFAGNPIKEITNMPETEQKVMTFEPKVCASLECTWCGHAFEQYSIRCRVCGNCQYCGMFCYSENQCTNCGNQLPDEFKRTDERRVVRFE